MPTATARPRPRTRLRPTAATVAILAWSLALAPTTAQQPTPAALRHPAEHPDHGLPRTDRGWLPFHGDATHPCNRIWRMLYLVDCVPAEVAGALPREHADASQFFVAGWYFAKRAGTEADRRQFGGDGRQLPVEGFDDETAAALRSALRAIDGDVADELKRRPRVAVWFQHDLLRLASRLLRTKRNPELLPLLRACAARVALRRDVLQSERVRTVTLADVDAALTAFDRTKAVEIERRSTRLFDAEYVQLWSTVHVQFGDRGADHLTAWLDADEAREPVPIGTIALLLQGIVAIDDQGRPCATDLIIEARTQQLENRDPLGADNPTTTRDGVTMRMWSLPRRAVRDLDSETTSVPFERFRELDMQSQELFRDYGTRKHTTYAAQCTLCHRRSNTPDEPLAGFSALRRSARPRPAAPGARRKLAEAQMLRLLDKLLPR